MARYTTILFDADNTLMDFTASEREAIMDTLCFIGVDPTEELITGYSAVNDEMWKMLERGEIAKSELRVARFSKFCARFHLSADVEKMAFAYTDFLSRKPYLVEGAVETCRKLATDCNLYIITNGLKFVQERRFSATPLAALFRDVFISEEIGVEKPQKAFFDEVARRIPDFSPKNALVIGDSLSSDIRGGINADIDTCWFNPKGAKAPEDMKITYTVRKLEEIPPFVLG